MKKQNLTIALTISALIFTVSCTKKDDSEMAQSKQAAPAIISNEVSPSNQVTNTISEVAKSDDENVKLTAFIAQTYAFLKDPTSPSPEPAKVFDKTMLKLMADEAASAPKDEPGALDFDPLCLCHDWETANPKIEILEINGNTAMALVTGKAEPIELILSKEGNDWRISDVSIHDAPSLSEVLKTALEERGK